MATITRTEAIAAQDRDFKALVEMLVKSGGNPDPKALRTLATHYAMQAHSSDATKKTPQDIDTAAAKLEALEAKAGNGEADNAAFVQALGQFAVDYSIDQAMADSGKIFMDLAHPNAEVRKTAAATEKGQWLNPVVQSMLQMKKSDAAKKKEAEAKEDDKGFNWWKIGGFAAMGAIGWFLGSIFGEGGFAKFASVALALSLPLIFGDKFGDSLGNFFGNMFGSSKQDEAKAKGPELQRTAAPATPAPAATVAAAPGVGAQTSVVVPAANVTPVATTVPAPAATPAPPPVSGTRPSYRSSVSPPFRSMPAGEVDAAQYLAQKPPAALKQVNISEAQLQAMLQMVGQRETNPNFIQAQIGDEGKPQLAFVPSPDKAAAMPAPAAVFNVEGLKEELDACKILNASCGLQMVANPDGRVVHSFIPAPVSTGPSR